MAPLAPSTFVGRESELKSLRQILTDGGAGRGRMAFIEGEAGTGKSFLVQAMQEQASQLPAAGKMRFVYGYCYEDTGGQNAYQPFVEILGTLFTASRTAGDLSKLFLTIAKETGSDWLNMIPGVGPAISAGLKTATIAIQWVLGGEGKQATQAEALATQYVQTIAKIAPRYAPLVLLIEDAHWIDDASCRLLLRLALKIQSQPLVIIVTFRPNYLSTGHPLHKTRNELLVKDIVQVMPLAGLNEKDIETYVVRRFGDPLSPKLAAWLVYLCKGHPLFVTQYLSLLEQNDIIRRADGKYILDGEIKTVASEWELEGRLRTASVPDSIEALLEQRIERLVEEDQEMLQLGAVQGEYFMSPVLAGLLKKDELDVLRRLRKVVEQHRLISLYMGETEDKARSEVYVFEHALLQQALYNKLSPRERVLYHRSIAEQLERMSQEQKQPSRKLILEIAHHYDLGEVPQSAANFYQLAAQSLVAHGANVEATEIAKRALRNVRQVKDADRLHAEIIELLLMASWVRWSTQPEWQSELPLIELAKEAEAAATRTGDRVLLARVVFQHGQALGSIDSLTNCLTVLNRALALIRETADRVGEFIILSGMGFLMRGQDFATGMAMQYEAYMLFKNQIAPSFVELPLGLKREFHIAQSHLGIGEFDQGNYSAALDMLEDSIAGLRELRLSDHLISALNYIAQVYIGMGVYEQGEAALQEAIKLGTANEEPHSSNGYNLALLGKLYLEWERVEAAVAPMLQGLQESQTTLLTWQIPLVRNYYVELLMRPDYKGRDLTEAERQLTINLEETKASGFHRSAVAALSMRSLIALVQNQIDTAVDYSTQAVTYLQKLGTLPALRTEEVLFNHYRVMKAAGREQEGRPYLEQAYAVLQKKVESIKEDNYRKSFLERVPLSRAIVAAIGAAS